MIVPDGCMITSSLKIVNLFDPDPDTIDIKDIARGLSNICRWNGQTKTFWSVAQHCCMAYDMAPNGTKLSYLLHDAEEAYWGDIIKPLKNMFEQRMPEIIILMDVLRKMIYAKFNVPYMDINVKRADKTLLLWEFENVVKKEPIKAWPSEIAYIEWMKRYESEIS